MIIRAFLFFLLVFLSACGGGTVGTDGGVRVYSGSLSVRNGSPSDVTIVIASTGEEVPVDDNGNFQFSTDSEVPVQLIIRRDDEEVRLDIPVLDTASIQSAESDLHLSVDFDSSSATLTNTKGEYAELSLRPL